MNFFFVLLSFLLKFLFLGEISNNNNNTETEVNNNRISLLKIHVILPFLNKQKKIF